MIFEGSLTNLTCKHDRSLTLLSHVNSFIILRMCIGFALNYILMLKFAIGPPIIVSYMTSFMETVPNRALEVTI